MLSTTDRSIVVGRFAPSPSGRMHAGNIFASLVAWLYAKRASGHMVLRIEDLDTARSKQCYIDGILRDYELLGLTWDEGPYYQSNNTEAYERAFNVLSSTHAVYPCFCTRAEIAAATQAPHTMSSAPYPGTCRLLSAEQVEHLQKNRQPAWRVAVPESDISFFDQLQGPQLFNLQHDCGDFIIRRNDGAFAYQLAVVVDDAACGTTQVVRGCDLLQSTAQQLFLMDALRLAAPEYVHVPLLVNKEGKRLAKRDGDASLETLLQTYKTPEAILGHIAYIAGMVDEEGAYSSQELLSCAHLDALKGKQSIEWRIR